MKQDILVLGGSGFVGRAFCEQWSAQAGNVSSRLQVPTRKLAHAKHLLTLPKVDVVEASVHDDAVLATLLQNVKTVINLVAILHGQPTQFEQVHVTLPQRILRACEQAGVKHLIHVSALGVPDSTQPSHIAPSHYLRSKARGEAILFGMPNKATSLTVTVLRPSVIFGEHDQFLNLFARMQAIAPMIPLASAHAKFQPVWVNDVARALVALLQQPQAQGKIYECVGPDILSLADLVRLAGYHSGHVRPVISMPDAVGRLQAAVLACLPGQPLMSVDNLNSMKVDNVATGKHPNLQSLGIEASSVHAIAPIYLRGIQR